VRVKPPAQWTGILLNALALGMPILRNAQLFGWDGVVEVKPEDMSLLTWVDKEIERIIRKDQSKYGRIRGEELGDSSNAGERYLFVIDPVDGTRTLVNHDMGGASIIIYVYDTVNRCIVASAIGRPGTGEVWVAEDDHTTRRLWDGTDFKFVSQCSVWEFDPAISRLTIYVDNPNAFTRRGVDMLHNDNLDRLDKRIREMGFTKLAIGSNGTHHGILSSGGATVGTITTSIGGIQDLGGILIVENAGGIVSAFSLNEDRQLVRRDPHADLLMSGGYDFLICAIDARHLEILEGLLEEALFS